MSNINTAYFASFNPNEASDDDQAVQEVCIANISPRERQIRLNFAIGQFMISLVVLAGMIVLQVHPLWRLLLFFMFSASTVSFFQARDKT